MLRTAPRVIAIGLLSFLATGCWVLGFPAVRSAPAGPPPGVPPTPVVPTIQLEYAGARVVSVESSWNWWTSNSSFTGSGMSASGSPGTRLSVPAGSSVDIVVAHSSPPAVLWVAELNGNGVPTAAQTLVPSSSTIPYTLTTTGSYRLQVMAEWSYQNMVSHIFELAVTP